MRYIYFVSYNLNFTDHTNLILNNAFSLSELITTIEQTTVLEQEIMDESPSDNLSDVSIISFQLLRTEKG